MNILKVLVHYEVWVNIPFTIFYRMEDFTNLPPRHCVSHARVIPGIIQANLIHLSIKMARPHQSGAPFVGKQVFQNLGQAFLPSPHHLTTSRFNLCMARMLKSSSYLLRWLTKWLLWLLSSFVFITLMCVRLDYTPKLCLETLKKVAQYMRCTLAISSLTLYNCFVLFFLFHFDLLSLTVRQLAT